MILRLKKSVAFVGMMGAGKTAIGRAVAEKLNAPFLDSDHEIEQAANMSVAEIFARDGEAFFRDREAQVIRRLFENEICVLSTGGGAFMSQEVRQIITHSGISLWIKADLDLLWSRVKSKDTRPLLQTADPYRALNSIFKARKDTYALADLIVEAKKELSIGEMAERVIDAMRMREDVLECTDGS